MSKNMTPSAVQPMTDGQIDKAVDIYRAILRKHRLELGSDAVQQVLGQPDYVEEQTAVLRKRAEAVSGLIVRHVHVNRHRTPEEALKATGRKQYTDNDVVKNMPNGKGDEGDVIFFKLGRFISDDDLEKEYALRGLKQADPYLLAAVNEADLTFADEHPNCTHWKDEDGKWCYVAFNRWDDERYVFVNRGGSGWDGRWRFAGVRK